MKVLRNALFATGTLAVLIAALVAVSPQSPHPSATHPDYSGTKAEAAASSGLASGPSWAAPATPLPGPAFDALSDDPRTKEAAVAFVLPGPPPAAEVRDALPTLLPGPAPDASIDDPRTKEAALVTFVLPGPPPAAEVRDELPGGRVSTDPKLSVRAPGEVSGAEIAQLLAARPRSTRPPHRRRSSCPSPTPTANRTRKSGLRAAAPWPSCRSRTRTASRSRFPCQSGPSDPAR